jgi:hypothetical protein
VTDAPSAGTTGAKSNKPDAPPGQAKKDEVEPEGAPVAEESTTPVADAAAEVINDLKALVVEVQQAFDEIRVTVQTKLEEALTKLAEA